MTMAKSPFFKSKYLPTVCLEDWWLAKSEDGKRLCVGGLDVSQNRARRVFSSAPITKRYNLVTLKTADNINILIKGTIDHSRSLENGFSSEVCSRFLLGFPYDWEDVADRCLSQESVCNAAPTNVSDFDESTDVLSSLLNCLRGNEKFGAHDSLIPVPGVAVNSVMRKDTHMDVLGNCRGNEMGNFDIPISADYMNAKAVKSADLDLPVTEETSTVKEDCGVPEGTRENEDNYKLSNDANLSDVKMIPPIDLQSSCEKFESSKSTSQGDKKTTTNLKSVGPENLRCSYDTGKDEVVKDAQASIGSESSDVKNAVPYKDTVDVPESWLIHMLTPSTKLVKAKGVITRGKVGREGINSHFISEAPDCGYEASVDVPVESCPINMQSLSTNSAKSKGVATKGKIGHRKKKEINSSSISRSPGCEVAQIHVKEDLIHGSEGNLDGSVSETPVAATSVLERSGSCSYHTMEESTLQRLPKTSVSCSVEVGLNTLKAGPSKAAATRHSSRLTKTEGKGNKNRASNCCNENTNSIPGPRLEAFETPQKMFFSNPSSCNIDGVKENASSSNGKRASGRIKKMVNTNSKIQHEREKANFVSVGSDSVKSYVANADGELSGSSTPDEPNVQLRGTIPKRQRLRDHYSKDGHQTDLVHSSVPTGAAKKIISESGIDGAEVGDMRKSFTSLHKVGDVKDASDLVSKEREESKHSQLGTPGSKMTKKDVPSLPSSGSKKKKQYSNARECPNLNLKRSRSGRLFTPPQFWRDQQLLYDKVRDM